MTCKGLEFVEGHGEAGEVLTVVLLAGSNFGDDVSLWEIGVFGYRVREEETSFVGLIEGDYSFGMCRCGAGLIWGFLIVPCYSAVLLFVEGVEGVGEGRGREVYHGIEVLKLCSFHGWVVVAVGVGAVLGRDFKDNPPGDWLSILIEAVECECVAEEYGNKDDHNNNKVSWEAEYKIGKE